MRAGCLSVFASAAARYFESRPGLPLTTGLGTPLDGRPVTKRFQKLLEDAKIPRHRFHDLRHTAATLLAAQGVPSKAIQSVLGWDQVAMLDRYAHFVDEMRRDAATKRDAILKPVAVKPAKVKAS